MPTGEYFTKVSAGINFCLALTNLGNVYAWGNNVDGELGQGNSKEYDSPVKIDSLSNIIRIDASVHTGLAVDANGKAYSWGYANDGQLGYAPPASIQKPKAITALDGMIVTSVSCGYDYSATIDSDGRLYTFGSNKSGSLGVVSEEALMCENEKKVTNIQLVGSESGGVINHSFTAQPNEEYIIQFAAKKSGTYTFSFGDLTPGTVVMVYRDANFTTPYKQTNNSSSITVGVEENDTAYIRFSNTNGAAYSGNVITVQTSEVVEDNKMIYIVLYDSEMDRYLDNNMNHYEYSIEFFKNYFSIIVNKNVCFVLSDREADYDLLWTPASDNSGGKKETYLGYDDLYNHAKVITEQTINRYNVILSNMYVAYSSLEFNEKPASFPKVYLGTPHFDGGIYDALQPYQKTNYIQWYLKICQDIYEGVTSKNKIKELNTADIAGIYYGKEDPFEYVYETDENGNISNSNIYTLMFKSVSEDVHSWGKKVIWFPYTSGQTAQLQNIGIPINKGKDFSENDLIDIAVIQPNYFYYELNTTARDKGYKQTINDLYMSTKDNAVEYKNENNQYQVVGDSKTTTTRVAFEIEVDMSIVTGRSSEGNDQNSFDKTNKLAYTIGRFRDLIYDNSTSYGVYIGGPNEQGFTWNVLSSQNDNFHSNMNYRTLLGDAGKVRFYEFKKYLLSMEALDINNYDGKLIYDIGYLLWISNISGDFIPNSLKAFFGDDNINLIYLNNYWSI